MSINNVGVIGTDLMSQDGAVVQTMDFNVQNLRVSVRQTHAYRGR